MFNLTPENYYIDTRFKKSIAMTTFETDGLPQHWLIPLRAMDGIITYTDFNVKTFCEAGIGKHVPIYKIPHGVDVDRFNPEVKPLISRKTILKDKYVFGANFDWSARKNPEALLEAYLTSFTKKDDVVLLLKVYHQFPIHKSVETMKNKIDKFKTELGIDKNNMPPIVMITDILSPNDMPGLYTSMDCYVYPTRGEGWSLTSSEAMASGLPVITTNWSGHLEFMNDRNSFLIDYKLVDVDQSTMRERPFYSGQKWADINVEALGAAMKICYENPEKAKAVGKIARKEMWGSWTWEMAAHKLAILFKTLGD